MNEKQLTLDRLKSILKTHKETQIWRQKRIQQITGENQKKEPTSLTAGSTAIIPSNALMLDDDDDILASISSARQQLLNPLNPFQNNSFQNVQSQTQTENENDNDDDDEFSTTLEQVIQPLQQQQQQQQQTDSIGNIKTMTTKNPITKTLINNEEEFISPTWEMKVPQKINSILNNTNTNVGGIGISNNPTDISLTKQQKQSTSSILTSSAISKSTTSSTAAYGLFGTGTSESLDIY